MPLTKDPSVIKCGIILIGSSEKMKIRYFRYALYKFIKKIKFIIKKNQIEFLSSEMELK